MKRIPTHAHAYSILLLHVHHSSYPQLHPTSFRGEIFRSIVVHQAHPAQSKHYGTEQDPLSWYIDQLMVHVPVMYQQVGKATIQNDQFTHHGTNLKMRGRHLG